MPDDTSTQGQSGAASAAPSAAADVPTFTREELQEDSILRLGHPSHVIVGALYGSRKKHFTVEETEKAIDKFLKAEEQTER